jgi:molybdopterin synthase catalytic subunit
MPDGAQERFLVTDGPIDLQKLVAFVTDPAYGAVATFVGTVRSPNAGVEVAYIDYEGYDTMIRTQMAEVAAELRREGDLGRIALAHRLGRLRPGEASIAVVVSGRHRRETLAACQRGIDLCKERLPVWKYEVGADGGAWVAGSSGAATPL